MPKGVLGALVLPLSIHYQASEIIPTGHIHLGPCAGCQDKTALIKHEEG